MKTIEIDSVEVSDKIIDVTYWITGQYDLQSIMFRTRDFEKWLKIQRTISIGAYWDQWNANSLDRLNHQIVMEDLNGYLSYRIGMFKPTIEKPVISYADKKPMTRVSKAREVNKGKTA